MKKSFGISIKGGGGGGSGGPPSITKVASAAARSALTPALGDFAVQLDDYTLWAYNGVDWELHTDGGAALYARSTDEISLSLTANDAPYTGENNTLEATLNLSATAAGAGYGAVELVVEPGSGLRAQVAYALLRAVFGATSPLTYDSSTGTFSLPAATNAAAGHVTAAQITALESVVQGLADHLNDLSDAHDASAISYNNVSSGLTASDVQAAIDELKASSGGGGGTSVSLAAFGATPNANGLSLSGQVLSMQPASETLPGGVSTAAQVFGGEKRLPAGANIGGNGALGASEIFSVISTTKGAISAPVMTETERNAIATPAVGLQIYNTTAGRPEFYDGTLWQAADGSLVVFDTAEVVAASSAVTVTQHKRQRRKVAGAAGGVTAGGLQDGTYAGQELILLGTSDTDTLTIENGVGLMMNGSFTLGDGDMIGLTWDSTNASWREMWRSE